MILINLLPWRIEHRRKERIRFFVLSTVFFLSALFILVATWIGLKINLYETNRANEYLKNKIQTMMAETGTLAELQNKIEFFRKQVGLINDLEQKRDFPVKLLQVLVQSMPIGCYLTDVRYDSKQIELEGVANSHLDVNRLIDNLKASGLFVEPKLVDTKPGDNNNSVRQHFMVSSLIK